MKNICIIYNSKISLFNKFLLNRIIKILKKENHVETFATERVGHATLLCKVHIKKFDIIVAAGGDGTINEVINGMDEKIPLGIIPLGTANIGAYEANISKNPTKAAQIILSGKIKKIHIQEANNRKFFLMTGVGYDASIVETIQSNLLLKKIFGKLLFFIISFAKLIYFKKYELKILANNKVYLANWVIITNAKHYGGAFQLTKDTDIFEKKLITYSNPKNFFLLSISAMIFLILAMVILTSLSNDSTFASKLLIIAGPSFLYFDLSIAVKSSLYIFGLPALFGVTETGSLETSGSEIFGVDKVTSISTSLSGFGIFLDPAGLPLLPGTSGLPNLEILALISGNEIIISLITS